MTCKVGGLLERAPNAGQVIFIGECMIELSDFASVGDRALIGVAGDTLNAAIYFGQERTPQQSIEVSYLTVLGQDRLSDMMVSFIEENGVSSRLITRHPDRVPGIYSIECNDEGDRRFQFWRENSAARTLFHAGIQEMEILQEFSLIYVSGITLAILPVDVCFALIDMCRILKERGHVVVFDSNYRKSLWKNVEEAKTTIDAMWCATTVALPSFDDETALWPDQAEDEVMSRISDFGVNEVVLKDGSTGPWIMIDGNVQRLEYEPVTKVVDTTAAGDSFNGAYLSARCRGETIAASCAAGHRLASKIVCQSGAIVPAEQNRT
jgi:2-dehydro-3-deoxygluconokinase